MLLGKILGDESRVPWVTRSETMWLKCRLWPGQQ